MKHQTPRAALRARTRLYGSPLTVQLAGEQIPVVYGPDGPTVTVDWRQLDQLPLIVRLGNLPYGCPLRIVACYREDSDEEFALIGKDPRGLQVIVAMLHDVDDSRQFPHPSLPDAPPLPSTLGPRRRQVRGAVVTRRSR